MSEPQAPEADSPEPLLRLLGAVGRRIEPPEETRVAVYLAARLAWDETQRQRRQRRMKWIGLAAAAGVAALTWSVAGYFASWRESSAPLAAESTLRLAGGARALRIGERLDAGADRGLTLEAEGGIRVRLDRRSRVLARASDVLALESGRLYFETAATPREHKALTFETPFGRVTHLGTRYALAMQGDALAVQVRDGRVRITSPSGRISEVEAGWRIVLDAAGQERQRVAVARSGELWNWVDALAPPLPVDGRTLFDVLEEIAWQSGRRLEYANEDVRRDARRIRLNGPFIELPMGDRLFAVLVTTGLEAVEDGDRIMIRRRLPARSTPS